MTGKHRSVLHQLASLGPLLAALYVPLLLLLLWIAALGEDWAGYLLRDPHSLADMPFFAGLISNVGALLWTVALTVCFFCGAIIRGVPERRAASNYLLVSGALTTLLMLDDFFLLHEDLFRYYLPLPESLIFGVYALLALGLLIRFRSIIGASEYLLLALALLLLGCSVAVDTAQAYLTAERFHAIGGYVLEDGLKFAGIVTWMVYYLRFSYAQLVGRD